MNLQDWREEYNKYSLKEEDLPNQPFSLFSEWFDKAVEDKNLEPNAMILSTCMDNIPSSRVVLLKEIEDKEFVFYTNYLSHKGRDISHNPNVHLLFFWPLSQRQVRITGLARKLSREKAIEYFHSRPIESQISAISSPQSEPIHRNTLIANTEKNAASSELICPEHWGGYGVQPLSFEFWQGQPARLHDRIVYKKTNDNHWEIYRLAP